MEKKTPTIQPADSERSTSPGVFQEHLLKIYEQSLDGILVLDKQWHILSFNPSAKTIFDLELPDVIHHKLWEALPELSSHFYRPAVTAVKSNDTRPIESYYPPSNKWLSLRVIPDGENLILFARDVSEHQRHQKQSSKNERVHQGIMANILDGLITVNQFGIILTANPSAEKLTGYSAEELMGNNISMLMDTPVASEHDQFIKRFLRFGEHNVIGRKRSVQVLRKDGGYFEAEIAINKMAIAGETIFIGSIYDITERKQHEKRIRELARFPEETWNPVMKITEDGILDYANSRCEDIKKNWRTDINQQVPSAILKLVTLALQSNKTQATEVICESKVFSMLFAPVPDLRSVYIYGRDITKQKQNEKEILEHRAHLEEMVEERTNDLQAARNDAIHANKTKSIFLANMSHEIRTPLTAIIGYAETLLDEDQTRDNKLKSIRTIIKSGHHLKNIINDILDLSKIEAEKLEVEHIPVNIFETLADVQSLIDAQAREKSLSFAISYNYPLPRIITTDPMRLKQVLINLCSNALKFTHKGSIDVKVDCSCGSECITFSVIDTGIGMNEQQLSRIFSSFSQADSSTTRKYGGTGLGLSLSKQLALMLGGDLTAKSYPGEGSTFTLTIATGSLQNAIFTSDETHIRSSDDLEPVQQNLGLNGRVLLAEDTPELQDLIAMHVHKTGAHLDIVDNGQQALERLSQHDYDLIIMDMQMPVMDGYTAVKTIRKSGNNIPIVAMTANAMREDRDKCLAAGCNDFISKPVQRELLFKALALYLGEGKNPEDQSAIVSSLLESEPDMIDLVEKFLTMLPGYIKQCINAHAQQDWEALHQASHKLKGLGGGYGYQCITDTASIIEQKLKDREYDALDALVSELELQSARAQKGFWG